MAEKIVSGAQTSADRALLDWAIFRDMPEDWAVVTGNPAPILRHHQRPSTLHHAREKSLDVEDDQKTSTPTGIHGS
jgi:hypothetical protein